MIKRRCQWFSKQDTKKKSPLVQCENDAIDGDYCCQSHSGIDNSVYNGVAKYCGKCRNPLPCKCIDVITFPSKHNNKPKRK